MYGGNANFYNVPLSEYGSTLEFLADAAGADTWVIPSVGPDYGRLMDQAEVLRAANFPTTMVLPQSFSTTSAGVLAAVRRFVDRSGRPVVLYLKSEQYLATKEVGQLASEGLVCAIKYAIPRENPSDDAYLGRLIEGELPRLSCGVLCGCLVASEGRLSWLTLLQSRESVLGISNRS